MIDPHAQHEHDERHEFTIDQLKKRLAEEMEMRDRYKRRSDAWRDKCLELHSILSAACKLVHGDVQVQLDKDEF